MGCCSTDHTITKTIFLQGTHKCFHLNGQTAPRCCLVGAYTPLALTVTTLIAPSRGESVMTRQPPVSYAPRFDAHRPNMTVTERFTTFRYVLPGLSAGEVSYKRF